MLQELDGNILMVKGGIICHQVNCKRVMGGGLALQIKNEYPHVFDHYKNSLQLLGTTLISKADDGLLIANMFGQDQFGTHVRQTNYEALYCALVDLQDQCVQLKLPGPIYFPKGMSSALAGGNWNIVIAMIEAIFPSAVIISFKG